MNLTIIVDDRERKVIPFFDENNMPFKVERVTVGDYSVICRDCVLINIERKSWKDLAASIKDGRTANVAKMIALRAETGCKLFYLIEGPACPQPMTKYGRIPHKSLRAHLDHLIFKHDIHIIHSKNPKHSADRIVEICRNLIKTMPALTNISGGAMAAIKKKTPVTDNAIIHRIWACVPNITTTTASLFIAKNYHIADLILGRVTKDEIYALKYINGHVIGNRANKIWATTRPLAKNNKWFAKMLSQLHGVTVTTAHAILSVISWEGLLQGDVTVTALSQVAKTEKRRLGPAAAKLIHKFFSKL
jgi:ERCC4-type nuclease